MKLNILKISRILAVSFILASGVTFMSCGGGAEDKPAAETTQSTAKTVKLAVSGMSCEACVESISTAVAKQEGVKECNVSLSENSATITYDASKTDADKLIASIEEAGYKAEQN